MGSRIWQQIEDFKEVENTVEVITGQNSGYRINESVKFFRPYRTDSNESDPYRYEPRKGFDSSINFNHHLGSNEISNLLIDIALHFKGHSVNIGF
jgi:hypothetical protein